LISNQIISYCHLYYVTFHFNFKALYVKSPLASKA